MDRKADTAYELIRQKIITGVYQPMTSLSEDELQKELNFSRTPVREALLRLRDNGFVIVFPKKGTIVSPVSRDLIDEIYEVRLLNEPCICQKASKNMPREMLEEIRTKLLTKPECQNEEERRVYYMNVDNLLHSKILQYCGNSFLIRTMALIYSHNERFRFYSSNPVVDHSIEEHVRIVEAMLKQDMELIRDCSVEHILKSKQITLDRFLRAKASDELMYHSTIPLAGFG